MPHSQQGCKIAPLKFFLYKGYIEQETSVPLGSSQLLGNKVEDVVEVVRLRHSVVVGPIWHLLPYFLLCPTDGIQLLHVLWSKIYKRMFS